MEVVREVGLGLLVEVAAGEAEHHIDEAGLAGANVIGPCSAISG